MPDSPYISDPSWTCTITAGSPTVPVTGVVAHLVIQPGDHLIGAAGGGLAIGAVTASTITLLRNAPAAQAGSGIPLIVERGPWRAMPAAAAIVSREVYERMQIAASDGRSLPVIGILNTPPASPAHRDRYLIGTSPTGAWAGMANSIAEWSDVVGGWVYAAPVEGWSATLNGTKLRYQYGGSSWGTSQVAASDIAITPVAGIAAANVQAVVAELARPRATGDNSARTILSTERDVILTAALTAARVWTLPAANAVPAGTAVSVADEVGGISSTNTLTIQRTGSDTIEGATSLVLGQPYQGVRLVSDGVSRWTEVGRATYPGRSIDGSYSPAVDLSTTLAQYYNIDFVARGGQVLLSGAIVTDQTGGTVTGVQGELRLVDTTTGTTVASRSWTAASGGTGNQASMTIPLAYGSLVVGRTYSARLWVRKGAATGPINIVGCHISGLMA